MTEEFILALEQIAEEKKISKEAILEATESALAAAYRKDYGKPTQIVKCKIDPAKGKTEFWMEKKIVEEVADENSEILLADAKKAIKDGSATLSGEGDKPELEGAIKYPLPVQEDFGRIAAQTAKQVIIQKLKEVEREVIFNEFKNIEGKMVNGVVQQIEGGNVVVDLGRANGVMFPSEQIVSENYRIGQRLKVLVIRAEQTNKGPQIMVSRAHEDIIKYLFMMEVPEIESGTVDIMGIAREAGVRTKMAVRANQEGVDPVGSCVGQRGTRVQAVLSEVGNEKIDIVLWNEESEVYITNALSPAKIMEVKLDKKTKEAVVYVETEQLSLAIGKNGQNVRLAARLTDWKIDVVEYKEKPVKKKKEEVVEETTGEEVATENKEVAAEPAEAETKPKKEVKAVKEKKGKEKKEPKKKVEKKKKEEEKVEKVEEKSEEAAE